MTSILNYNNHHDNKIMSTLKIKIAKYSKTKIRIAISIENVKYNHFLRKFTNILLIKLIIVAILSHPHDL